MDLNDIIYIIINNPFTVFILSCVGTAAVFAIYIGIAILIEKACRAVREKRMTPEEIEFERLPYRCRECEVVGICRDKNNHWRCIDGCYIATPADTQNKNE